MAGVVADEEASVPNDDADPELAVICAFLDKFGQLIGIPVMGPDRLLGLLQDQAKAPEDLVDLHVKLLRKARRTVSNEKWERAVIKFALTYSKEDAESIETKGYCVCPTKIKIRLLKNLLESQFDMNQKFKTAINKLTAEELRRTPAGRDNKGRTYWSSLDNTGKIRVYIEDLHNGTWTVAASDRESLVNLLRNLAGDNEDISPLPEPQETPALDTGQSTSSLSDPSDEEEEDAEEIVEKRKASESPERQKKTPYIDAPVVSEAIEEPVLHVHGEGNGEDCRDENLEFSEAIEEPVLLVYGEGSGSDCLTANPCEPEEAGNSENSNRSSGEVAESNSSQKATTDSSDVPTSSLNINNNSNLMAQKSLVLVESSNCCSDLRNPHADNEVSDTKFEKLSKDVNELIKCESRLTEDSNMCIERVTNHCSDIKDLDISNTADLEAKYDHSEESSKTQDDTSNIDIKSASEVLDNNSKNEDEDCLKKEDKETGSLSEFRQEIPSQEEDVDDYKQLDETKSDVDTDTQKETENKTENADEEPCNEENTVKSNEQQHEMDTESADKTSNNVGCETDVRNHEEFNNEAPVELDQEENEGKVLEKSDVADDEKKMETNSDEMKVEESQKSPDDKDQERCKADGDNMTEITTEHVTQEIENTQEEDLESKVIVEEGAESDVKQVDHKEEDFDSNNATTTNVQNVEEEDQSKCIGQEDSTLDKQDHMIIEKEIESDGKQVDNNEEDLEMTVDQLQEENKLHVDQELLGCKEDTTVEAVEEEQKQLKDVNEEDLVECKEDIIVEKETKSNEEQVENKEDLDENVGTNVEKVEERDEFEDISEKEKEKESKKDNIVEEDTCDSKEAKKEEDSLESNKDLTIDEEVEEENNLDEVNEEDLESKKNTMVTEKETKSDSEEVRANEEGSECVKKDTIAEKKPEDGSKEDLKHKEEDVIVEKKMEKETESDMPEVENDKKELELRNDINVEKAQEENKCENVIKEDSENSDDMSEDKVQPEETKFEDVNEDDLEDKKDMIVEEDFKSDSKEVKNEENLKFNTDVTVDKVEEDNKDDGESNKDTTVETMEEEGNQLIDVKEENLVECKQDIVVEKETGSDVKHVESMEEDIKSTKDSTTAEKVPEQSYFEGVSEGEKKSEKDKVFREEIETDLKEVENEEEDLGSNNKDMAVDKVYKGEDKSQDVNQEDLDCKKDLPDNEETETDVKEVEHDRKDLDSKKDVNVDDKVQEEDKQLENIKEEGLNDEKDVIIEKETVTEKDSECKEGTKYELATQESSDTQEPSFNDTTEQKSDVVSIKESSDEVREEKADDENLNEKIKDESNVEEMDQDLRKDESNVEEMDQDLRKDESNVEEMDQDLRKDVENIETTECNTNRDETDKNESKTAVDERKNDVGEKVGIKNKETSDTPKKQTKKHGRKKKKRKPQVKKLENEGPPAGEKNDSENNSTENSQDNSEVPIDTELENKEASNETEKEVKKKEKRKMAKGIEREMKHLGVESITIEEEENASGVRQSRRIAQIRQREDEERRKLEELQLNAYKLQKEKKEKGGKKRGKVDEETEEYANDTDVDDDEEDEETGSKKKRRRNKKKEKKNFDLKNAWRDSASSSEGEEEDEVEDDEEPDEEEEEDENIFKSDHEFSPESDLDADPEYLPVRRARTARAHTSHFVSKYDDTACEGCRKKDRPESILLCDTCDKGWHTNCFAPALELVPEGNWYCPPCDHSALVKSLREILAKFDRAAKQRENEELRKKRLEFVGISLANVLPSKKARKKEKVEKKKTKEGSSDDNEDNEYSARDDDEEEDDDMSSGDSTSSDSSESVEEEEEPVYQLRQRPQAVKSYRYNEYDELIKSAIREELGEEGTAAPASEQKNPTVLLESTNGDLEATQDNEETREKADEESKREEYEEKEEELLDEPPPVVPRNRGKMGKKKKKLTSLEFSSEDEDDHVSDSDFKGSSASDFDSEDLPSESDSSDFRSTRKKGNTGLRRSTRNRMTKSDRDFINDETTTSESFDEEEDDLMQSRKRKGRRIALRPWETSEEDSDDSDRSWGRRRKRRKTANVSRGRATNRSIGTPRTSSTKALKNKKKRKKKDSDEDDREVRPNIKKKVGKIESDAEERTNSSRRTRGKKINFIIDDDDDDDEPPKKAARFESDEEFQADEADEKEEEEDEIEKQPSQTVAKKPQEAPAEEEGVDGEEEEDEVDDEDDELLLEMLEKGDILVDEMKSQVEREKMERLQKKLEKKENGSLMKKKRHVKNTPTRADLQKQVTNTTVLEAALGGVKPQPAAVVVAAAAAAPETSRKLTPPPPYAQVTAPSVVPTPPRPPLVVPPTAYQAPLLTANAPLAPLPVRSISPTPIRGVLRKETGETGREVTIATAQAPQQLYPHGEGGSVITRMLNAGVTGGELPTPTAPIPLRVAPPIAMPSAPLLAPTTRYPVTIPVVNPAMFHPLDPSPSGGGALVNPKISYVSPAVAGDQFGAPFVTTTFNPAFANSVAEQPPFQQPLLSFPVGKEYEEETTGEFGGLASYFASQAEEDMGT